LHQVLEWELLIHPAGAAYMREFFAKAAPWPMGPLVFTMVRRRFSAASFTHVESPGTAPR
jgi:hypothetical protein